MEHVALQFTPHARDRPVRFCVFPNPVQFTRMRGIDHNSFGRLKVQYVYPHARIDPVEEEEE